MLVTKTGVVGAGTMGQGIVEMLAGKGLDVILIERTQQKLEQAWTGIEASLD